MTAREGSFGQGYELSYVDRLGIAMSARRIKSEVGSFRGKRLGDFGSGYHALLTRELLPHLSGAVVVDLSLNEKLQHDPKITAIEGDLPAVLASIPGSSLDIVLCVSVLEHVWDPAGLLAEIHRVLVDGGKCMINVPSWWGKHLLEFSAFKLGLSPVEEMNDHKMYYDPRDLWPLLVAAGFRPIDITCRRHKFGLNTFATCTK